MSADWTAVDTLIRDLGAAVSAATYVREETARAAAERAIGEASEAINQTIAAPSNRALLAHAREAVRTAHEVIHSLDAAVARSRALRVSGTVLTARAAELLAQAKERRASKERRGQE